MLPCVAVGAATTVSTKVVVAAAHGLLLTVIVRVTVAPEDISAALKLYVGVRVVPFVIAPLVPEELLAVHAIVPLLDAYPAGIVYVLAVAQVVAVCVIP